ncbi:MAG: hypothetical protein COV52_03210 [Gammaproteobacteria bacterium CG11_big_fil_rev_8_21_14_0_20_46_22]|nr:MAG: hypothetical protein COW05_00890 [Gammaproteobacteria bacterium CG12_big_fil_rev_8_21_14_0_65_46_12]PIR11553.1 MAG: hypothetical protein COV52_03210 [Gammaproteobacteria bacterium CG11_big_fil_rev_8_21_14_0_20_46_22]
MRVTRKDAQTGFEISIHYEVVGQGKEVVVFHHGNGNSIEDWYTLGFVDALKNDFTLVLIDSRGYGKSSKPHDPKEYSLKSRADDTIAVLDQEKIKQAHCFGGSIGAAQCFLLARYYPKYFKSYIFATPYFQLFDETIRAALQQGTVAYVDKLENLLGSKVDNESIRQTLLANDARALWAANSSEWFDYQDYVQYVKSPALIYVGDQEPSVPSLKALAEQLKNLRNQCELQILPDMGHKEAYWRGDIVSDLIRNFVFSIRLVC